MLREKKEVPCCRTPFMQHSQNKKLQKWKVGSGWQEPGTVQGLMEWVWLHKRIIRDSSDDGNVLYLHCIKVNVLVLIFFNSFARY